MGYINRSRATGVSKGPGQQEAVSRLAEELTGKKAYITENALCRGEGRGAGKRGSACP
ncbi:hypothetical protein E8R43_11680 [Escherichia coli]|nr:hypothetical protein E8R43_11680 [Escherichia coli]